MIRAASASLVYLDHGKEVYACRDVDLEIRPNEFVGILGPSGSGKSSLLYLLSGLKTPSSGSILYEDTDLSSLSDEERSGLRLREFGFLFQQPFLLGYLTALENVLLAAPGGRKGEGREMGIGRNRKESKEIGGDGPSHRQIVNRQSSIVNSPDRALTLLEVLGLGEKTHRFPHELSGGERQRVCVARSLLGNPKVVFADEPTASLDHENGLHVVEMLNHHREGGALVMVTHDETMLEKADRVLRIAEGKLASSPLTGEVGMG